MTDKLVVGGIEMEDYPMGVVTSSSSWVGKLGLGPKTVYSSYSSSSYYAGNYPNFLQRMVSSGKIVTPSYSMWLDDAEGKSGSLLFGAVDYSQSYPGTYGITLNALNGTSDSNTAMAPLKSNDYPFIMSVSPGEPFSYFPPLLAAKMMTMAGARYNRTVRKNVIDCDAAKTRSASFTIELGGAGGPMLNVPLSDLIMPRDTAVGSNSYARYFASGPANMCPFGIQNTTSLTYSSSSSSYSYSEYSLGTSLLRRSYLVFDQLNEEVSIAPVKFVASGASKPSPTIVAFASSGAPAPSADRFCTPGTSVSGYYCSSSGGGGGGGSGGGGTDTGSGSSGSGNSTSSNTEIAIEGGAAGLARARLAVKIRPG
ncbi:aspartic peptidase domain-containing protein [Podospora didyma]|uniref:Aspartic peptidase domain-containing protein n=1 Tax=Podospora didyma TaxID=330526 RepID=A0AAE0N0J4_9PEZI|nr:aspartic peptidase domain-containing protein [Podospora didyma]